MIPVFPLHTHFHKKCQYRIVVAYWGILPSTGTYIVMTEWQNSCSKCWLRWLLQQQQQLCSLFVTSSDKVTRVRDLINQQDSVCLTPRSPVYCKYYSDTVAAVFSIRQLGVMHNRETFLDSQTFTFTKQAFTKTFLHSQSFVSFQRCLSFASKAQNMNIISFVFSVFL